MMSLHHMSGNLFQASLVQINNAIHNKAGRYLSQAHTDKINYCDPTHAKTYNSLNPEPQRDEIEK